MKQRIKLLPEERTHSTRSWRILRVGSTLITRHQISWLTWARDTASLSKPIITTKQSLLFALRWRSICSHQMFPYPYHQRCTRKYHMSKVSESSSLKLVAWTQMLTVTHPVTRTRSHVDMWSRWHLELTTSKDSVMALQKSLLDLVPGSPSKKWFLNWRKVDSFIEKWLQCRADITTTLNWQVLTGMITVTTLSQTRLGREKCERSQN